VLKQFKPRYRPHIDGLRTIAVLSVLLYHLGASYLPGGFTGVDVFFVISGFLISRIIYSESLEGGFSVTRFYERRAKRILPAFAVVTALTTIGVYFLFLPSEFLDFSESVLAAVFFSANVYFYMTADYFAPAAHSLPALHYWSLGVEEQFYVFFPLIVFAIVRFRRNYFPIAIGALLIASLMASEVIVRTNPPAAFYLLPYRASELLIGCIIALPEMRFASSIRVGAAASWAGITLLASGLLFLQPDMRFPGINALPPTVGTALVLWGNDRNPNIISRVLGTLPMTWMGKLSYSLYLIHWPLILFAERLFPYAAPGVRAGGVFVLSVILASLSYRFVEQPFRRLSFWTPSRIFAAAGASLAMLVLSSAVVMYYRGFPGRLDSTVAEILAFERYDLKPQFRSRICFLDPDQAGSEIDVERCLPKTSLKKAVLWGDAPRLTSFRIARGKASRLLSRPTDCFRVPSGRRSGSRPTTELRDVQRHRTCADFGGAA
jgi:peptidoglycan/LPS O-acetylase OafA/YrhL